MTAIRSIVAATDFSPGPNAAVERAVSLAATHGASPARRRDVLVALLALGVAGP